MAFPFCATMTSGRQPTNYDLRTRHNTRLDNQLPVLSGRACDRGGNPCRSRSAARTCRSLVRSVLLEHKHSTYLPTNRPRLLRLSPMLRYGQRTVKLRAGFREGACQVVSCRLLRMAFESGI